MAVRYGSVAYNGGSSENPLSAGSAAHGSSCGAGALFPLERLVRLMRLGPSAGCTGRLIVLIGLAAIIVASG